MSNKITYKDIYDAVASLETKMDKRFDEMAVIAEANSERITVLEYWKASIVGKLTLVAAVVGFAVSVVQDWMRKKTGNLFGG